MKPMDILKKPAPKPDSPSRTLVQPPLIPPQVPPPAGGEYARLMKRHDRMNTRHVKKA